MLNSTPTEKQISRWTGLAYRLEDFPMLAAHCDIPRFQETVEAAEMIVAYLLEKEYISKPLGSLLWQNGRLNAKDENGFRYVIIGRYVHNGFLLNGVVRSRTRRSRLRFYSNGQASEGALQVAHIAEQDIVPFPEIEKCHNEFSTWINNRYPQRYDLVSNVP